MEVLLVGLLLDLLQVVLPRADTALRHLAERARGLEQAAALIKITADIMLVLGSLLPLIQGLDFPEGEDHTRGLEGHILVLDLNIQEGISIIGIATLEAARAMEAIILRPLQSLIDVTLDVPNPRDLRLHQGVKHRGQHLHRLHHQIMNPVGPRRPSHNLCPKNLSQNLNKNRSLQNQRFQRKRNQHQKSQSQLLHNLRLQHLNRQRGKSPNQKKLSQKNLNPSLQSQQLQNQNLRNSLRLSQILQNLQSLLLNQLLSPSLQSQKLRKKHLQ